jgi:hypothetical protein
VHGHPGREALGGPVGARRLRVREPLEHARRPRSCGARAGLRRRRRAEGAARVRGGRALANRGCSSSSPCPRARGRGRSATPRSPAAQLGAPGPRTRDRVCRARTAGTAGRSSGGGGDRARGGLAARRSEARSRRAPPAARGRVCRRACGGQGRAAGLALPVWVSVSGNPGLVPPDPHPCRPGRGLRFTPRVRGARAGRSIRRTARSTAWVRVGACGRRVVGSRFASR